MPGGLSQMVILGEELNNVNETIVAFMQMIRIIIIMFVIPFLTVHFLYSGQELATVTAYQLFRLFFILLIVPSVLKWWVIRAKSWPLKEKAR